MFNHMMLNNIIRFISLAFLAAWCFILIGPFIPLVLWGTVIAIALYPIFLWLSRCLGNRQKLAAVLIVLLGIGIILGPVSVIVTLAIDSIQTLIHNFENGTIRIPPPPSNIADWPVIGEPLSRIWQDARRDLFKVIEVYRPQISAFATKLLSFAGSASLGIIQFVFSIIIAGVLMFNATVISKGVEHFIRRLSPHRGPEFLALGVVTIRNVCRGVIGIALFQTLLLGIGLVGAHIPFAELLTIICLILSIMQIGPVPVVLAAIFYAWSKMPVFPALLFTLWMLAAGTCDNFLKPILMARGLAVPMLVIFIGVIGGTLNNGLIGLFMGPVVLSLGYELLRAWIDEDNEEGIEGEPIATEPRQS